MLGFRFFQGNLPSWCQNSNFHKAKALQCETCSPCLQVARLAALTGLQQLTACLHPGRAACVVESLELAGWLLALRIVDMLAGFTSVFPPGQDGLFHTSIYLPPYCGPFSSSLCSQLPSRPSLPPVFLQWLLPKLPCHWWTLGKAGTLPLYYHSSPPSSF